jgi:hypothetical protein
MSGSRVASSTAAVLTRARCMPALEVGMKVAAVSNDLAYAAREKISKRQSTYLKWPKWTETTKASGAGGAAPACTH